MRLCNLPALWCLLVMSGASMIAAPQQQAPTPQQPPSSKWWQSDNVKAELRLTAQQSAAVEAIFQATLPKLRASKGELDRLETQLSKLLEAGADEPQVVQQIDHVEAARSEMSKTRTLMLLRMRRILTEDQRAKLTAIHERTRERGKSDRREQ